MEAHRQRARSARDRVDEGQSQLLGLTGDASIAQEHRQEVCDEVVSCELTERAHHDDRETTVAVRPRAEQGTVVPPTLYISNQFVE